MLQFLDLSTNSKGTEEVTQSNTDTYFIAQTNLHLVWTKVWTYKDVDVLQTIDGNMELFRSTNLQLKSSGYST